eukprot:SAG11_NODE_3953_length_2134_cov_5.636364_2_plen_45_part_01
MSALALPHVPLLNLNLFQVSGQAQNTLLDWRQVFWGGGGGGGGGG